MPIKLHIWAIKSEFHIFTCHKILFFGVFSRPFNNVKIIFSSQTRFGLQAIVGQSLIYITRAGWLWKQKNCFGGFCELFHQEVKKAWLGWLQWRWWGCWGEIHIRDWGSGCADEWDVGWERRGVTDAWNSLRTTGKERIWGKWRLVGFITSSLTSD